MEIPFTPEIEAKLKQAAAQRGITVEEFVQWLIGIHLESYIRNERQQRMTLEEFEAALDSIAQYSHKIPDLPDEAFTRESIYKDHD